MRLRTSRAKATATWVVAALGTILIAACQTDQNAGVGGGAPSNPSSATLITPSATVTPTPAATPKPTAPPAAPINAPVRATQAPPPAANTCGAPANPWGYNFCGGNVISNPPSSFCSSFSCIASFWTTTNGYVEQCVDGLFSHSGGRSGSCSHHGGNRRPLYGP